MDTKTLNLSEQELQQYIQIDSSIAHWSAEHTKAQLQANRLLSAVSSMYDGRMSLMNKFLKDQGMDPTHVHQVNVNSDTGAVTVTYDESVPNPAAEPVDADQVSPNATPIG